MIVVVAWWYAPLLPISTKHSSMNKLYCMLPICECMYRYVSTYRIPGIFRGMHISRLSMKWGFLRLKFCRWRLSKNFCIFHALLQGYVRKMYATNVSKIDKTLYQRAYHSQSNPRPPCSKSWESVLSPVAGAIKVDWWHHHALLKNNVQMHEMTRT